MDSSKHSTFVYCVVLLVQVLIVQSEKESVCYEELGCFSVEEPWSGPLRPVPLPAAPSVIETRFYLYTRKRPTKRYYVKTWPNIDMKHSYYDGGKETVFIIHGFMSTGNDTWLEDMKNAYLNNVDANVFVVDWGIGASDGEYNQVCANIRVVAAEITRLSRYLVQKEMALPIRFHMIGHSLGAHIAGYVAKSIPGIGRITGLDPAQLLFEGFKKEVQLDADDALFVEVMHTDAKPTVPLLGAGILRAVGKDTWISMLMGVGASPGASFLLSVSRRSLREAFRSLLLKILWTRWCALTTVRLSTTQKLLRIQTAPSGVESPASSSLQ